MNKQKNNQKTPMGELENKYVGIYRTEQRKTKYILALVSTA